MAASGRDYRKALVGTGWAISLHLPKCLRKQFGHVGSPFMAVKHVEQAWYASKKMMLTFRTFF